MDPIPGRLVEEWLWKNKRRMIACPFQPGQLRISKDACKKRLAAAKSLEGEFFRNQYQQGLLTCKRCPIGESPLGPRAVKKKGIWGGLERREEELPKRWSRRLRGKG